MGAPAITYFCENGHIVAHIPHGHYEFYEPEKCSICCSTKITSVLEWGDPEYDCDIVPLQPITHDQVLVSIPVYNVERLFAERWGDAV